MTEPGHPRPKPRRMPPPPPAPIHRHRSLPVGVWVALGVGTTVLLFGLVMLVFMILKNAQVPVSVVASESGESSERQRRSRPREKVVFESAAKEAQRKAAEAARQKAEADKLAKAAAAEAARQTAEADSLAKAAVERSEESKPIQPDSAPRWNQDILAKNHYLPLPMQDQTISVVAARAIDLVQVNVADPGLLELETLSAAGQSEEEGFVLTAEEEEADDVKFRRWIVERKTVDPFTKLERRAEVGTFELKGQQLSFQWNVAAPDWAKPRSLQYCLLNLTVNGQTETCILSEPTIVEDLSFDFTRRDSKTNVPISEEAVEDPRQFRLDLNVSGLSTQIPPKTGLQIVASRSGENNNQTNQLSFRVEHELSFRPDPVLMLNGDVEIELTFELDAQRRPALVANAYVFPSFVRPPDEFYSERTPEGIILSQFDAIKKQAVRSRNSEKSLLEKITKKDIPNLSKKLQQEKAFRKDALVGRGGLKLQAAAEEIVKKIEDAIRKLEGEVPVREATLKLADAQANWSDEMEANLTTIQKAGRIGYSLYVEIEGKKVYFVRSKSHVESEKSAVAGPASSK